jgi:hypothetical protein
MLLGYILRGVALATLLLALAVSTVTALPGNAPTVKDNKRIQTKDVVPEPKAGADTGGEAKALSPEDALKKAQVNGKYRMLLRQFKVPQDIKLGGEFHELGLFGVPSYAGQTGLPTGYWVYVYPYWYIWRDLTAIPSPARAWGPEQVIGPPDTPSAGDFGTAWASLTPDEQDEWLLVEFSQPVQATALHIHESWKPGAVSRVSLFRLTGEEVEVWHGIDPTPTSSSHGVSVIPIKADFKTNRALIGISSMEVRGWNAIDAVGLIDNAGKTHWATAATASSTHATSYEQATLQTLVVHEQRVRLLENEVRQLRKALAELKKAP